MKRRVSIAEAKQTLPALVHEVEKRGEVELTRRGKTVAYLVSADVRARQAQRTFVEAFEQWRERYASVVGDEPLELPRRSPSRRIEIRT
jgi:prevent-host-death family protein